MGLQGSSELPKSYVFSYPTYFFSFVSCYILTLLCDRVPEVSKHKMTTDCGFMKYSGTLASTVLAFAVLTRHGCHL